MAFSHWSGVWSPTRQICSINKNSCGSLIKAPQPELKIKLAAAALSAMLWLTTRTVIATSASRRRHLGNVLRLRCPGGLFDAPRYVDFRVMCKRNPRKPGDPGPYLQQTASARLESSPCILLGCHPTANPHGHWRRSKADEFPMAQQKSVCIPGINFLFSVKYSNGMQHSNAAASFHFLHCRRLAYFACI